jgi:hypothetical protein
MNGTTASRNIKGEENYTINGYGTPAWMMGKFPGQRFIKLQRSEKYN